MTATIRQYLADQSTSEYAHCSNFYDWFCKDSSLKNKEQKLIAKLRQIADSGKIDQDKMYVVFRNNRPLVGSLYDDIRICSIETGDVIFTIVPSSGLKSKKGKAEVWGKENSFKEPLVQGTWKDVMTFFNVGRRPININATIAKHVNDLERSNKALRALAERVTRLNPNAGEIGDGMLASLIEEAKAALGEQS